MNMSGPFTKYDQGKSNLKLEGETWWDAYNRLTVSKLKYEIKKLEHKLHTAKCALAYRGGNYDPDLVHWRWTVRTKAKIRRIVKRILKIKE